MISGLPNRKRFPIFWVACIFFLILGGCSGNVSDEDGITFADGTETEDTGAGAFSVRWEDLTTQEGDSQDRFLAQDEPINCTETGVAEVHAEVYDETGRQVATGGPWPCDLHSGAIRGIPAGDNRKIVVKGVSTEGEPYFVGEVADVTILTGATTSLGMVEMAANIYVESGKLQYRTYPDSSRNQFRGDIDLSKAGKVFMPDDIQKFELKDNTGSIIPIQTPRYAKYTYFEGTLDTGTGYVSLSESKTGSGFSIRFPSETSISAGNYMYEITTKSGQKIQHAMSFPGKLAIQPVNQSSMQYEWLEDGGLRLSWQNPSDAHTTTSMWLSDENWKDLFYIRIPPEVEEITIPAQEISKITNERGPISAKWTLRVGIRNEEGIEYARAYSDTVEFNWNEVKFDYLDYFPLSEGNRWSYTYGNTIDREIRMENYEVVHGVDAIQRVHYSIENENIRIADDGWLWSYDSEFLYIHGERQINDVDWDEDLIGLYAYDPPLRIERFMGPGDSFSTEFTITAPDNAQYAASVVWENLGFEDTAVPAGFFPNTLRLRVTQRSEKPGDEFEESLLWHAKGVGEIQEEESEKEWKGLMAAEIIGNSENLSIPWTPQFQFQNYADSSQNRFGGWLNIRKNGISVIESDITNILLRRHNYTEIPITKYEFGKYADFYGSWDEQNQQVNINGPNHFTDFGIFFPEGLDTIEGNYIWEITSVTGEVLTYPFYFPGKEVLPVPESSLMDYEWLSDGSLKLGWINPLGNYDNLQIALKTPNKIGGFYMHIHRNQGLQEVIIPAQWVNQMSKEYGNPDFMNWTVRTRAYSDDGMSYARAFSDTVEIPWQTKACTK
jgi:hypothetical protein